MTTPIMAVLDEQAAQLRKWGVQDHTDEKWLRILAEEFGEVAIAMNEHLSADEIEKELIQVAAVAVSWVESRQRQGLREAAV